MEDIQKVLIWVSVLIHKGFLAKMEVSGRRTSNDRNLSLSRGSADDFEFSCQPCAGEGHHVEAAGFCQNCEEYLCITCYKYHCKPTPSRHHVLLDKYNMPKRSAPASVKYGCNLTCTKHASEIVKFFCKQHDAVGCGDCVILDHKSCKIDYIPDDSKDFIDGGEYEQLVTRAKQLENNAKSLRKEIEEDAKEVYRLYTKAVWDIRAFRIQVDRYLIDMEQKLLDQCETQKKKSDTMLKAVKRELQPMQLELENLHSQLTPQEKQSGDLFVRAKQISFRLKKIGEELEFVDEKNQPIYIKNRLVVSYINPPKVEILSLDGKAIQMIDTDSSGEDLFQFPRYVAVHRDGNCIYVSDFKTNSVTKVTTSGTVLDTYEEANLSYPDGIAVFSDGSVIVCNSGNHNLYLLSSENKKIKTVLDTTTSPHALCFNRESDSLFLSFEESKRNTIHKYKFTY
ncbi:E3 ubiquitin-protein ligase TRIM33-like [Mercenaria mercenaria]|uniref:E3 ubiquitin-protein ligase TRIM33-like n=1 Tax=Mercenaria mercenaria TaxID=6596 RepID=UPI00234E4995|nr:E3 ubiquitin-protein ligase TRIM33-like [Mercenaria mercenaria]